MDPDTTTSKPLAPEDICVDDYVCVLHVTSEYLDIFSECQFGPPRPFRVRWLPPEFAALHVVAVCLPFVLVEDAKGASRTLDVRRYALTRLDEDFARKAMKRCRKSAVPTKPGEV